MAAGGEETVEILVPRLAKDLKTKKIKGAGGQSGWESGEETSLSLSKKAFMRKKVTMAAIAAAEAAALAEQAAVRQLAESGTVRAPDGTTGVPQVMCELCLFGEVAGSKNVERMIPCSNCSRRYHRNCLKRWASNRDLFNWSSWVCGSCRICEVCRRTGEPNKLMFCKRCDEAYHSYCQQPPAKQVSKGAFLCPKHTLCHGCGSHVPGSGVSSRWFMGYTNCDACGRLFIKGKYCPICLKVYRDSEATPMVCCDNCEHWIHCQCDGISDEKYQEFQLDNDLRYVCAVCRGECKRVKDMEEATEEIWRRRDEAERDLILHNQAVAGLPSREDNMKLCPSDDDDDDDNRRVEDRFSKKPGKPQTVKGKDREGKLLKKLDSSKQRNEKPDKVGTTASINKFKITLPMSDLGKQNLLEERTGEEGGASAANKILKKKKKKDESVVKLTKYMIQARESIAAGSSRKDAPLPDQTPAGFKVSGKDFPVVSGDNSVSKFSESGGPENPVKTFKFVDNANDKAGTKLLLHVPSKQKGTQTKVKMKIHSAPATVSKNASGFNNRNKFSSDEEGSDGADEHEFSVQGDRNGSQSYYPGQADVILQQNTDGYSPKHAFGGHEHAVRGQRTANVKYRDKGSSVQKPPLYYKNSYHVKETSELARHEDFLANEERDSNDTSSGKQGASLVSHRKREREHDATSIYDEDFMRKRWKPYLGGRSEATGIKEASKVSLKLKLKKLSNENGASLDHGESLSPNHGNGHAIRGQRSKRKKHHLLESARVLEHEHEVESQTSEEAGKEADDSWISYQVGRDAIGKRGESVHPTEESWHDTAEFGKRRMRVPSNANKHFRR